MLHLRIYAPASQREAVAAVLRDHPAVSSLAVLVDASVRPPGDVILADVAREAANDVIDRVRATGVQAEGAIQIEPVRTWISREGLDAERRTPGSSADAVVWADVVQRAYEDSELTWSYVSFMLLATLLASIAIVLDSPVLLVGAMVLGPEFGAIAALGLALVRRRRRLFSLALRTVVVGFASSIVATTLLVLVGRWLGWIVRDDVAGLRPSTAFIYQPGRWSLVVAVIAGAAGVLSLTSARTTGLVGVFVSVTTVPAAGNVALGLAFGVREEVWGSTLQLLINITGMAIAGWATLAVQSAVWGAANRRHRR
ncbi:MAG TPA: DUF389 domain-containing protein [Actinomycetes bacterium]